jgi:hypothetical protein
LKGTGDNYIREEQLIKIYMSNKVVYIYNDDDILMDAVKQTRAAIITSRKFTPFGSRIKAMGLAPTRLAICSFIYGCIGICYVDDELHYDSGLATGYWWKTKF